MNSFEYDSPTPAVGSEWEWQGGEHIKVIAVVWANGEWWVRTEGEEQNIVESELDMFASATGFTG